MIQSKSMARWLAMSVIAGVAALSAAPASAQATLDTVKKRGKILCGVSPVAPGFSYADDKGIRRGFGRGRRTLPVCLDAEQKFFQGGTVTPGRLVDRLTQQLTTEIFEGARVFLIEAG